MRSARLLAAVLLGALLSVALWYRAGLPREVPGGLAPGERIQCASYTPIEGDETPGNFRVERARLDRDFALLATRTECLRVYSVQGLELVPEVARAHGLQLIVGAWVNREEADTEREIAGLIELARRYPDVIREVLVGNEVLLRRERTAAQLAVYLRRVRAAVEQPVSYGDVWEFWLQNPELGAEVDFLTIHLLPYWENQPTGIEAAIEAVAHAHAKIAQAFPGKPILIGETGWPSEGRRREDAVTGRVNEARFIRGFLEHARREGWRYNLIEAFDQPWKRAQEGAVGGYWGLFDAERRDKGVLAGPVSDLPEWRNWLALAAALWLAVALLAWRADPVALMLQALAANGAALHLHRMTLYSRSSGETLWHLTLAAAALLSAWLWTRSRGAGGGPRWTEAALVGIGALACVEMLSLAFDPRYRDFPLAVFLAPAVAIGLGGLRQALWRERGRALGLLLLACTPAVAWQETLLNPVAVGWIGLCAAMAYGLMRPPRGDLLGTSP